MQRRICRPVRASQTRPTQTTSSEEILAPVLLKCNSATRHRALTRARDRRRHVTSASPDTSRAPSSENPAHVTPGTAESLLRNTFWSETRNTPSFANGGFQIRLAGGLPFLGGGVLLHKESLGHPAKAQNLRFPPPYETYTPKRGSSELPIWPSRAPYGIILITHNFMLYYSDYSSRHCEKARGETPFLAELSADRLTP